MSNSEFEQLFKTYFPALCIYAEGMLDDFHEAEDLVEDIFVKILLSEPDHPVRHWGGYLYRATRNACLDILRRKRITGNAEAEELEQFAESAADDLDAEQLKIEVYRELALALEQLSPRSRRIVRMAYLKGMPSKEIARELDITVSTVDNTKAKAILRLRKLLSKRALSILMSGSF